MRNNTLRLARSTQWCVLIATVTLIWTACGTSAAQIAQPPAPSESSTEAERQHELKVACLTGGGIWSPDGCRRAPENAPRVATTPTAALSSTKPVNTSISPSNGCGGIINQNPHLLTEEDFTHDVIDCLVEMTKSDEPIHIIHGPSLDPDIVREVRKAWQVGTSVLGAWGPLVITLVQMNDPEAAAIAAEDCEKRRSLKSHVPEGPNACETEKTAYFNTFTECCGATHDPAEPLAPIRAQFVTFASVDQMFKEGNGDVAKVFLHEYMHVFQNGSLVHTHQLRHPDGDGEDSINKHGFGPVWIEEAAAEYFGQRFATENGFWDKPQLRSAFEEALRAARQVRAEWGLSLRDVETRTEQRQVNEKCECGGALYYETGIVATSWLVNRVGSEKMLRYYTLVAYQDWQDVFNDVFGLSLEAFYTEFDQWLDRPFEQQLKSMVDSLSK